MSQFSAAASDAAFLSGDTLVVVVPKLRTAPIRLLCGREVELTPPVPLWVAAYLKKRDKCFIKLPEWLEPDNLQASLAEERDNPDRFSALPHHYVEIAKELLQIASEDLPEATRSLCHRPHASANKIRGLVADIEDVRRTKLQTGLRNLDADTTLALDHMQKDAAAARQGGGTAAAAGGDASQTGADVRADNTGRLLRALQGRR
ncbi:hypothetical protein EMIHUDRAFT_99044 [Emiliania huxleyi CCMP1516]|uniref:GINS subunit domain-containing protein n=2 Tax=Emiliania huxleyi TaxID=2903 RepID=A0A0D3K8F9_EMIH1|nr:hypothetical protein EMIHUDRAFT_99044 [Emiliania huxleyi CCMP1516]EOD32044.1 hypothetical protein EMIHUDRAFT_99044 [Emiliania huxleyi CCMP1516]|eukprot:XP_005784473.1 hypothetical protein EMIHUDRAFT_99044 [Emiliania huxleyi CCMP1516]